MASVGRQVLQGRWVHSHEEDTNEEMVFRRAGHPFPRSRGRASFDLRSDGSYLESSPGPVDAPEASTGRWTLEADRLILEGDAGRPGHAWRVAAADDDCLRLER